MKEAFLYSTLDKGRVQCHLCAHGCVIGPGKRGRCQVRENQAGRLYSLVYGRLIAQNVDPIEKKPLFHFLPGSRSFSIATVGCNFTCRHCQNSDISQMPRDQERIIGRETPPEEVVAAAKAAGCGSISYTYTEPTVFGEYVFDCAGLAQAEGLKNVLVSNGFQSPEAVEKLAPVIDAANLDLKAFSEDFYKSVCGARLQPVLEAILNFKKQGVWVELTTLLIPGLNDAEAELDRLAGWIAAAAGVGTPWHVSRFHPDYRLTDRGHTPAASLQRAAEIGRAAGLHHVYLGNLPGRGGELTTCPECHAELIDRFGFTIRFNRLREGACFNCGRPLEGVF